VRTPCWRPQQHHPILRYGTGSTASWTPPDQKPREFLHSAASMMEAPLENHSGLLTVQSGTPSSHGHNMSDLKKCHYGHTHKGRQAYFNLADEFPFYRDCIVVVVDDCSADVDVL